MPSIEVVIGLILIILFYSLLATIIMELISGYLSLRGKHLEKILKNLLSSSDRREELFEDFIHHPLYEQLSGQFTKKKKSAPSYLSAQSFREILLNVIDKKQESGDFMSKINNLPDHNVRELLNQFMQEVNFDPELFKVKIENWYDEVMDRASGWYTRNVQKILLVLGFAIAVAFNVDTLALFDNLMNASQEDLENLALIAESTVAEAQDETYETQTVYDFIKQEIEDLKNPLGLGWTNYKTNDDVSFWLLKIVGWLITAVCISKGTPFWFDLLNKIIRFRGSGNIPKSTKTMDSSSAVKPDPGKSTYKPPPTGDSQTIEKPVG